MPTYRNDSENTYKVQNSDYKTQIVQPGESVRTLQILEVSGMVQTDPEPFNPKVWLLDVKPEDSFIDNEVDVGAALKAKSGYIRSSDKINIRFNSVDGETVEFDPTEMGYTWSFSSEDDMLIKKIFFENPAASGAGNISVQVFAVGM